MPLPEQGQGEVLGVRGHPLHPVAALALAKRRGGWTFNSLGQAAGVSPRTIESWTAHSASPSLDCLTRVLDVLGLRLIVHSRPDGE